MIHLCGNIEAHPGLVRLLGQPIIVPPSHGPYTRR